MPPVRRAPGPPPEEEARPSGGGWGDVIGDVLGGDQEQTGPRGGRPRGRMSTGEVVAKQVGRSVASQIGNALGRAIEALF